MTTPLDPRDWRSLEPHYHALQNEPLTAANADAWLERWSDLEKTIQEALVAAYRAKTEDTTDDAAQRAYLHLAEHVRPHARTAANALKHRLLALQDWTPGPEHAETLRRFRAEADLFRDENTAIHAALEEPINAYGRTVGRMTVNVRGDELTLDAAAQDLQDPDRATRETTWRAMHARWLADRRVLDDLYLNMLGLRRQLARNAGLRDYREYAWREKLRFDYAPEDTLAFHDAVERHIVPLAARLSERRRAKLGAPTVRPWDTEVDPDGRPALRPFRTAAELEAGAARIFHRLDAELGAEFDRLRGRTLDLVSRKGKAPGGYCEYFPQQALAYIFMNAVGTHDDVQTLLHEGGHAFHAQLAGANHPVVFDQAVPMEFAEVASMSMELLAAPLLERDHGGFYDAADARRARREHLEGIVRFLPYMAVVDAFQHWVYSEAPEDVTARDLDAKWDELYRRFRPDEDWTGLETERATGWHRKLHIFEIPFYYVEYGIAQLGALQVWRNALQDPNRALEQYKRALALGGTRPLPALFEAAGARLALDDATVGELTRLLEAHLDGED